MSSTEQNPPAALASPFTSTAGGVMTTDVGAITGELELLTRPTTDESGIEAMVRYAGARDLYTVAGSPLRTTQTHEDIHEIILKQLTTPGRVQDENELPVGLTDPS